MDNLWLEASSFRFTKLWLKSFLQTNPIKSLDPKDFHNTEIFDKGFVFYEEKLSKNQEKFDYCQHFIHNFQDKNLFANKIYPKNKYYHAVVNLTEMSSMIIQLHSRHQQTLISCISKPWKRRLMIRWKNWDLHHREKIPSTSR